MRPYALWPYDFLETCVFSMFGSPIPSLAASKDGRDGRGARAVGLERQGWLFHLPPSLSSLLLFPLPSLSSPSLLSLSGGPWLSISQSLLSSDSKRERGDETGAAGPGSNTGRPLLLSATSREELREMEGERGRDVGVMWGSCGTVVRTKRGS